MRLLLFALIFLSPPFLKVWLIRIGGQAKVGRNVHIGWFSTISASQIQIGDHATIRPFTLIRISGKLVLDSYSEISSFNLIYGSANFEVGKQSYIGPQSLINVDEDVRIGTYSALGPRSMVFTHGSFLPYTEGYWVKLAPVQIGDRVWCAAGVFLHPGTVIGDNSFVNSRSVVTQTIPAGSVVEGNPATVVRTMESMTRRMSPRRTDVALEQVLSDFVRIHLFREEGIHEVQQTPSSIRFMWRNRAYVISIIPSTWQPSAGVGQTQEAVATMSMDKPTTIYLVNHANWPFHAQELSFDIPRLQAVQSSDPMHHALWLFMQRYYGMRFSIAN